MKSIYNNYTLHRSSVKGSVTIEAALSVPIFLFAVVALLYLFEFHAIQSTVNMAAMQVAKVVATDYATHPILSPLNLQNELVKQIGKERMDRSIIMDGSGGVTFHRNILTGTNDELILDLSYRVKLPVPSFTHLTLSRREKYRVKAWTGFHSSNEDGDVEVVYVTENGVVYHENYNCSHLQLSIRFVPAHDINALRNDSGGKYHPCERCALGDSLMGVYITDNGNRYHFTLSCSGLKRTIHTINRNDKPWLPACSRCSKNGGTQ